MSATLKRLPHSTVELRFEIDPVKLEVARKVAFDHAASQVKAPGFRAGKAPKHILEQHVNQAAVMQQALDDVLNEAYREALQEHELVPVAQPEVDLGEALPAKPIEVTAKVQIRPEVTIGDWRKIKADKPSAEVDDKKVDETMQTIFERSTAQGSEAAGEQSGDSAGLVDAKGNPLTKPEMDDAWAKKLGLPDLASLREQVKVDLQSHAEYDAQNQWQEAVLSQLIDMTKADLPPAFAEDELHRMRHHFEQQLAPMQMTLEQYLEQSGKTLEEMEAQWKPQADKQATLEVALAEVARQEKVEVTDDDLAAELANAEPAVRAQFENPDQRQLLAYSLWRQKVLRLILEELEAQHEGKEKKASKK